MVIYDNETLSQTRAFLFKPATIWAAGVLSVLAVGFLSGLFWAYFPGFHQGLPGMIVGSSSEYQALQDQNAQLEKQVAEMDSMLQVLQHAMSSGASSLGKSPKMYQSLSEAGTDNGVSGNEAASPRNSDNLEGGDDSRQILLNPIKGGTPKRVRTESSGALSMEYACPHGSKVSSIADGRLILVSGSPTATMLGVWHSTTGMVSFYHMNGPCLAAVGDVVSAGQPIGISSQGKVKVDVWMTETDGGSLDFLKSI
jgi:hypothetical protein